MKIGIFGGCFNPPHKMHKEISKYLINNKYLDKIIYVPTESNYNKKDLIKFIDRYNMLELMVKDLDNVEISDIANNGYYYTYQVLDYFKNKYAKDQIYFICGSDNLRDFEHWKCFNYILTNYNLLVIKRNKDNIKELLNKYNNYNIKVANIKKSNISSTIIRNKIKDQKSVVGYLDNDIIKYINENNLYRENDVC